MVLAIVHVIAVVENWTWRRAGSWTSTGSRPWPAALMLSYENA
jgi:hypothetical protein